MNEETLVTSPTEAYLNNRWAIFVLGTLSLTRDEMRARSKDTGQVTSIYVPVSCVKCGAPFRATECCTAQEWNYRTITNMGAPL